MANEITKVNGVTKKAFLQFFIYDFPLALITADTNADAYILVYKSDVGNPQTILFSDVTDKLGQATLEDYIDELANQEFFFDIPVSGSTAVDATIVGLTSPNPLPVSVSSIDASSNIQAADSASIDAFGRWRVSEVTTQLDIKYVLDNNPLFVDEETIGTGSSNTTGSETTMSTAAASDAVIRQTFQRGVYQSGKSAEIYRTFRGFETVINGEKLIGYYSASTTTPFTANKDGILLRSDGTTIYAETYNNGTATSSVARANWYDPLDGTGISGINHNFDLNTILNIDFEWLSYGRVRFFIVDRGLKIPFHQVVFVNGSYYLSSAGTWATINASFTSPYMLSPNQPYREELRQSGAGSNDFTCTCSTFGTEGGLNQIGQVLSDNVGTNFINANSTSNIYAILGIRLKTGVTASVITIDFTALAATNDDFIYYLYLNPTVAGTFTYSGITNSNAETAKGATGGTNTVSGGTLLQSGYGEGNSSIANVVDNAIKIGHSITGVADEIVLAVQPLTSNLDIYGSLTWKEFS